MELQKCPGYVGEPHMVIPMLILAFVRGGPNFGIVTEFTYRAYEQGPVFMWVRHCLLRLHH